MKLNQKSKLITFMSIALLIIAIIGAALVFYYNSKSDQKVETMEVADKWSETLQ